MLNLLFSTEANDLFDLIIRQLDKRFALAFPVCLQSIMLPFVEN